MGIEPPPDVLPFAVQCPLCGEHRLNIYEDSIFGGCWGYCFACKTGGDLIEWASWIFETNLLNAVIKLDQGGITFPEGDVCPQSVQQYQKNYLGLRDRIDGFWQASQRNLANDEVEVRHLLRKIRLRKELRGEAWISTSGRYIGANYAIPAAQVFQPKVTKQTLTGRRFFTDGPRWNELLVIPFHDMPGRISGFLYIGRDGEPKDVVFRGIGQLQVRTVGTVETGLAMYDTTYRKTTKTIFGNTTFVMDNVLRALQLQIQHLNDHKLPLPVVATYNVVTSTTQNRKPMTLQAKDVWQSQPTRRYVFWSPRFTAETINTASRVGAKTFIGEIDTQSHRILPPAQLRRVYRQAQPWRSTLMTALTLQSQHDVVNTLNMLNLSDDVFRDFLQQCPEDLRQTITDCSGSATSLKYAYYGGTKVKETPDGWFVERTGRMLCDAILRIDKILRCRTSGDSYYQGRILYKDQAIPFMELATRMDKQPLKIMEAIIATECGVSMRCTNYYKDLIIDVAKQFHIPEIVVSSGSFGWDPERACFSLPRFTLGMGGNVQAISSPFTDTRSPGLHLEPPTGALTPLYGLCDTTDANRVFWATAASIGANVIAPAVNHPVSGIGLVGQGALSVGLQTSLAWGCPELHLKSRAYKAHTDAHETHLETTRHNWPTYVRVPHNCQAQQLWLTRPEPKNVVTPVDEGMMNALGIQTAWRYIVEKEAVGVPTWVGKVGDSVLTYWLCDITSRRFELDSDADIYVFRVLEDIAEWMERRGYNATIVRDAGKLIDDAGDMPCDRANRLAALLHEAITNGVLGIEQSDFPEDKKSPMLVRIVEEGQPPGVFLARATLQKVLSKQGITLIDPPRITEMLQNAGALARELEYNEQVGWLIADAWWQKQSQACRARMQKQFRVVG